MNVDDGSVSKSCAVSSKYFTGKSAMDDSLSDFQEPKKCRAGPKNTTKPKNKSKKALKRPRGQKDIRTALQSTKKELESYSKDFDKICKKSGIDIDSEELQLAIALSKSLQNTASTTNVSAESSQVTTSQERIGKIRTTLQEYGFKVPEVKIVGNIRKTRKHRKNYKLIQTSETEKKEVISDRYSQVLFQNITHCSLYCSDIDTPSIPLYYLATNVSYDILRVTDTFYVNSLLEKSISTGNLLRDWSKIPGRPESPKLFEPLNMNFSEIECSQEELDIVLSGTIKSCKDIVTKKTKDCCGGNKSKIEVIEDEISNVNNISTEDINTNNEKDILIEERDFDSIVDPQSAGNQRRSLSPDMFDDDALDLFDKSKNLTSKDTASLINKQVTSTKLQIDVTQPDSINSLSKYHSNGNLTKRKSNDPMELTKCILIPSQDHLIIDQTQTKLSQKATLTIRKSNDFMELTECVTTSSQPLQNKIDLTQSPDIIEEVIGTDKSLENNDIDLTKLPDVIENYAKITDENKNLAKETDADHNIEIMDLTQSSNTSDDLPFVSFSTPKGKSSDDTIVVDIDVYARNNKETKLQIEGDIHIDLTQCAQGDNEVSIQTIHSQSFFKEYNHDHSESTEVAKETNSGILISENQHEEVDLTESSENRFCNNNINSLVDNTSRSHSQLKQALQPIVEPMPVELHPSNSQLGQVNLTLENNISSKSPKPHTRSSLSAKDDAIDDIDLTQKSDTSEELSQTSKNFTPNSNFRVSGNSDISNGESTDKYDYDLPTLRKDQNNKDERNCRTYIEKHDSPTFGKSFGNTVNLSNNNKENRNDNDREKDSTEEYGTNLPILRNSQRCSSLGKKDNVSIDYDELINSNGNEEININNVEPSFENQSPESLVYKDPDESFDKQIKNTSTNCSQNSEVFHISDNELDYSLHQAKFEIPINNFAVGGLSILDDLSNLGKSKKSIETEKKFIANNINEVANHVNVDEHESFPRINGRGRVKRCNEISPIKHRRITDIATPQKASCSNIITVTTPKNSELIIKTNNVTPMIDYESMSTPDIHKELDKFGIKPFKRKRAIQLLTHIYNQTHPILENADELASPPKRHKPNGYPHLPTSPRKRISPKKLLTSPRKISEIKDYTSPVKTNVVDASKGKENISQKIIEAVDAKTKKGKGKGKGKGKSSQKQDQEKSDNGLESTLSRRMDFINGGEDTLVSIKEIECSPEDWVFQKREKAKVHSCRVPLHVAFYNYVTSRRDLREAILCYEPVEIDLIHKDLVGYGHRYDPKDLLKFLDKKCITVKTTDNDARNQKRGL